LLAAWALSLIIELSAMEPRPIEHWLKKWRRVLSWRRLGTGAGFIRG
jgi:hypothetical protein